MPNKHFCQGPYCHTRTTQDRFLKSRGVVRGRYARLNQDDRTEYYPEDKFFCSLTCAKEWLKVHMENIEQGRPIEFIRHRRESGGYEKRTTEHTDYFGKPYKSNTIERVDNRSE
jgi:hypothetical protein